MDDFDLVWLRTISEDTKMIAYRPSFRHIAGSVTAAILLQQILYRWVHNGFKPFYKYKEPCDAADYRPGDSWCEELAFSREEFDGALKRIGKKVTTEKGKDPEALVWFRVMGDRKTWYEVNYVTLRKSAFPLYAKRDLPVTQSGISALPILYTENTSKNTTESERAKSKPDSQPPTPAQPATPKVPLLPNDGYEIPNPPTNGHAKRYTKVTSDYYDPRRLVDGYIPAGQGTTAIEIYHEWVAPATRRLSQPNQADITQQATDLERWRQAVKAWVQSGHRPENVKGLLDWYHDPTRIPGNKPTNGNSKPATPERTFKQWLLDTYHSTFAATIKPESELRDEYRQWRKANGFPAG